MAILLWSITGLLALQLGFVLWNLRQLPSLGGTGEGRRWLTGEGSDKNKEGHNKRRPKLSVLIPARDEADNIAECLHTVLANRSEWLEVIVLSDRSTDGTPEKAEEAGKGDHRLRVVRGEALRPGWLGKAHACDQLAELAQGEWWLFLDADARLSPDALAAAMDVALAQGGGLVTGFPKQRVGSWAERLAVPLMTFTIACHLPIRLVRSSSDAKFVAAHGAFMLVRAADYRLAGGHAASPSHLVDDMQLARAFKQSGLPVTLANIHQHVEMRMYHNSAGVWNGFKKNLFAGVGRRVLLLSVIMAIYAMLYLFPPIALISAAASTAMGGDWPVLVNRGLLAIIAILLGAAIKFAVDRSGGLPGRYAWLLPPGIALLLGIAAASWYASASGSGYEWKGRHYS